MTPLNAFRRVLLNRIINFFSRRVRTLILLSRNLLLRGQWLGRPSTSLLRSMCLDTASSIRRYESALQDGATGRILVLLRPGSRPAACGARWSTFCCWSSPLGLSPRSFSLLYEGNIHILSVWRGRPERSGRHVAKWLAVRRSRSHPSMRYTLSANLRESSVLLQTSNHRTRSRRPLERLERRRQGGTERWRANRELPCERTYHSDIFMGRLAAPLTTGYTRYPSCTARTVSLSRHTRISNDLHNPFDTRRAIPLCILYFYVRLLFVDRYCIVMEL